MMSETMPGGFRVPAGFTRRADRMGFHQPQRFLDRPNTSQHLLPLADNIGRRRRIEGHTPSANTCQKFAPEVNVGRNYRVTGRDVTLRPGELTKGRIKNMKSV